MEKEYSKGLAPIALFDRGDGWYNIYIGEALTLVLSDDQMESLYEQLLSEFAMHSCQGR